MLAASTAAAHGADRGTLSLTRMPLATGHGTTAHTDATWSDADPLDPTPSLSMTPRLGSDADAQHGQPAPGDDAMVNNFTSPAERALPTLADRSLAFGAVDELQLHEFLLTDRSPFDLAPRLRIEFSRPTQLRDGGVSGSQTAFGDDEHSAFADDRGNIDMYNIAFRWDALRPGPLTFSLIGGVQAVAADIVSEVGEYDSSGSLVSTRLDDAYGITPVPVVGGGVRWDVSEKFYISGAAQTHTIPDGASLLDLTAQTGLDLSPTVGLRAGYQYLRTTVQVQNLDASLSVSGIFARLEIAF